MLNSIKRLSKLIEEEIKHIDLGKVPVALYDPLYYILSLGGKRVRPLLTLISYSMYKGQVEEAVHPALAVEVFHNFTLMHDDIMDNAPLRRGKITVHEKWNSNIAILSGDVMLIKAYELFSSLSTEKYKRIIAAFNRCATLVCEGQQLDMDFETRNKVSESEYIEMIKLKTAVLLGFSLELGAIIADADDADCLALRNFGINIGIGFQLKDDILDVYADKSKFGKQVGGDIVANKKTLLLIEALTLAKGNTKKELTQWITNEKANPKKKIEAVVGIYDSLSIRAIVEEKMNNHFNKGFESLSQLKAPKYKVAQLKSFAEQLINRES